MAPTPVLLPGKSHGRRSPVGCSPRGRWESDTTEWLHFPSSLSYIGEGHGNPSSVPAWRIPGTGEPGGLPSMGSHRVGHDWGDSAAAALLYLFPTGVWVHAVTSVMSSLWPYKYIYYIYYIALHTPLSLGFSRQAYWNGLPCPPLGDLPNPGIELMPLTSPALAGGFFTTSATWETLNIIYTSRITRPLEIIIWKQ